MNNIHIPRPVAQIATHQAQFQCSNAAFPAIRHQKHVTENIWSITLTNCDTVVTTAVHILLLLLLLLTVDYLTQNKIKTVKYLPFLKWHTFIKDNWCEPRNMWVPVTTAWRAPRLRKEERPLIWRVAANILNKQSKTADKGWSSSFGVGWGANNSSPLKRILLRNIHKVSDWDWYFGTTNATKEGHEIWYSEC